MAEQDPTKAVRLAEMNYHLYPESQSAIGIFRELYQSRSEGYCKQTFQKGHTSFVTAVAFSPDGSHILIGSWDQSAKLWDLQGNEIQTFSEHTYPVYAATFSADGRCVLTGSGGRVYLVRGWSILRVLAPWSFLAQRVERLTLGELKTLGIEYTQKELTAMEKRRAGKLW